VNVVAARTQVRAFDIGAVDSSLAIIFADGMAIWLMRDKSCTIGHAVRREWSQENASIDGRDERIAATTNE
jgi:hypothetical protein